MLSYILSFIQKMYSTEKMEKTVILHKEKTVDKKWIVVYDKLRFLNMHLFLNANSKGRNTEHAG